MIIGEKVKGITICSINQDGSYSEPVRIDNLTSVTFDEPSANEKYITWNEPTTFTATLNLPRSKMSKKKFKKWCMSHKISRDEAELLCQLIRIFNGDLSYQGVYRIGCFMPTFKSILDVIVCEYKRICREKQKGMKTNELFKTSHYE